MTHQKTGENRPHVYNFVSQPDRLVIVDFAATMETEETTVELTLEDGELRVYVKSGPDCKILADECYDVTHTNFIDFGPESTEDFSSILLDSEPDACQEDYRQHYEHEQWWVVSTVSGETWSVTQNLDNGEVYAGFELISEGVEE